MWKRILTMSLGLVMVLSLTTCAKAPSSQEIIDGVIESFDNPTDEVNGTNIPPSRPTPVSFDEVRRVMDAVEGYVMTTVLSETRDEYTLRLVISNDRLEMDVAVTESPFQSKLGSQFRLVLLGQEAIVQPKSVTGLQDALLKSGALDVNDDSLWVRIDLGETWPVFHELGSRLSWQVPSLFTQVRAEIHRPLLFDPRIPLDFFDVSVQGEESKGGLQLTRLLVQTDWLAVCQWLIDSGTLTRAWEGPVKDWWSSKIEIWVDKQNLVRQIKVGQSDRFAAFWVVWIDEPFGSSSYGYAPQFSAQDVVVDFTYDEVPEVVPAAYDAVVLTKDMLR